MQVFHPQDTVTHIAHRSTPIVIEESIMNRGDSFHVIIVHDSGLIIEHQLREERRPVSDSGHQDDNEAVKAVGGGATAVRVVSHETGRE